MFNFVRNLVDPAFLRFGSDVAKHFVSKSESSLGVASGPFCLILEIDRNIFIENVVQTDFLQNRQLKNEFIEI